MADKDVSSLLTVSSEDQKIAVGHYEYAHRAMNAGNHDLAIQMLRNCCRLVPSNLSYRQTLRKVEKTKYKGNLKGSFLAPVTTAFSRMNLWKAHRGGKHRKVLELGEAVLTRNPWDRDAHLLMAEAAEALGLRVLAVWILQEGRERDANDVQLNRALARLLEKEGRFTQAIQLWELVRKVIPDDREAQEKAKHLAVSDTLARGNYGEANPPLNDGSKAPTKGTRPGTGEYAKATPTIGHTIRDIDAIRQRIVEDPTSVQDHLRLANLLIRQGKLDDARTALEQGLAQTNQAIELSLAHNNLEIDAYKRALTQNEEQLRAKPNDEKLQKTRGKIERKIASLELSLARRKVEHDPESKQNRFDLGVKLFQAGLIEEAIPELQNTRSDARLQWKSLMYLGHCFLARQNWPLARRNLEEALRQLPETDTTNRKEVLFHLAQGHAEAGELARAVELAVDLADLDYAYKNIGQLMDEWQRKLQTSTARRG